MDRKRREQTERPNFEVVRSDRGGFCFLLAMSFLEEVGGVRGSVSLFSFSPLCPVNKLWLKRPFRASEESQKKPHATDRGVNVKFYFTLAWKWGWVETRLLEKSLESYYYPALLPDNRTVRLTMSRINRFKKRQSSWSLHSRKPKIFDEPGRNPQFHLSSWFYCFRSSWHTNKRNGPLPLQAAKVSSLKKTIARFTESSTPPPPSHRASLFYFSMAVLPIFLTQFSKYE